MRRQRLFLAGRASAKLGLCDGERLQVWQRNSGGGVVMRADTSARDGDLALSPLTCCLLMVLAALG